MKIHRNRFDNRNIFFNTALHILYAYLSELDKILRIMYINISKLKPRQNVIRLLSAKTNAKFFTSTHHKTSQTQLNNTNSTSKLSKTKKNINSFGIPLINRPLERILFGESSSSKQQDVDKGSPENLKLAQDHLASFNIKIEAENANNGKYVF